MSNSYASHMERRKKSSGMSYRDLAKEFGVGKSTAHRIVTKAKTVTDQGQMRGGQALRIAKEKAF